MMHDGCDSVQKISVTKDGSERVDGCVGHKHPIAHNKYVWKQLIHNTMIGTNNILPRRPARHSAGSEYIESSEV